MRRTSQTVFASLAALALAAGPAAAQPAGPDAAGLASQAALHALDAGGARPVVELTVDEAVERALERNLDIAVERLNPQTFDLTLAALRSAYRPTLTSTFGQRSQVQLPTSQLVGGTRVTNETFTYNSGISQNLPWGGSASLAWNNFRQNSSNLFTTRNPNYQSSLSFNVVQPLLRGFRTDTTRSQLRITRINQNISELQLRGTIVNTLAGVRNAYWDLVYAVQAVDVARGSLELAENLVEDNRTRVEVGTMAPIDIVQAEAEAATRRQVLAQVEATWRTSELALKRLIVGGTDDPLWSASLDPTDRPDFAVEALDVEAAVRAALDRRTDLGQARHQIDANAVSVRLLRNQTLPAVDLVTSYGLQGLGGTEFIREGFGSPRVLETIPGGYGDALRNLRGFDYPSWNLAVNVSYPIGVSAAEANLARARVQQRQNQAQVRALELQVATEVTNVALQVESNLRRVEAATAARELAQRRLEAEESKFEVGMSTNFFVVQAQRDLADAHNVELRALLDYRKSLVDFERVQETSLARAGISIVGGGTGATAGSPQTGGTGTGGGGTAGGPGGSFIP